MKVLYLAPPAESQERLTQFTFVDEEVVALADLGIEICLVSYPLAAACADRTEYAGTYRRIFPSGSSPKEYVRTCLFLWHLRRFIPGSQWLNPVLLYHLGRLERFFTEVIHAEGIDLIHSNFAWPGGYGGVLAKLRTGIPLVTTLRGMDVLTCRRIDYGGRLSPWFDRAIRLLLKQADCSIHVSDFIRNEALQLGAHPQTAITIRKGVDCDRFGAAMPLHRRNSLRPTILTVCGLIPRKGVDCIVKSLGQLASSHDFSFVVVGDGPELDNLKKLTDDLSLSARTTFLRTVARHDIDKVFEDCDIFVLGSILEASGNVILEAMASGRPVICTDAGGPGEYVADGETGFVVPIDSPEAMAKKIRLLLDNAELRQKLGEQGKRRAMDRFAYSTMTGAIVKTYEKAMSFARKPAGNTG